MQITSSLSQYLILGILLLSFSGLKGQSLCENTSTCGPEWKCIDETVTILTCYECADWTAVNAIYEWTVEKCDFSPAAGTNCNSTTIVNTNPIVTSSPALSYTFNDVGVFLFKVVVRDPATGLTIATPCLSGSNCQTAEVEVFGTLPPVFTPNSLSCTYDPISHSYTSVVQIDPLFNQQGTGAGTDLDVDWGDGSTSPHFLNPGQPTNIQHTYTWSANGSPSFSITVDATMSRPLPRPINCSAIVSYTGIFYTGVSNPDVSFVVNETDCNSQTICIEGAEHYNSIDVFDEDGQLVHSLNPNGTTPCFNFQVNGAFTFFFSDGSGNCLQVVSYNVLLAPPTTGALSSPDSYVRPGDEFTLNLTNPDNHFVTYEILEYRNGQPFWLLFHFGPAAQMNNFLVPDFITQQFTPAMLNSDFEFCFRASVLCDEADISLQDPNNGTFSNVICLAVCAGPDDGGGGGGDNPGVGLTSGGGSETQAQFVEGDASSFLVYPNPVRGPFTIEWDALPTKEPGLLEVQNILGQVIWKQGLEHNQLGGGSLHVNLPKAAAGRYSLIWTTNELRTQVGQLIIVP